MIGSTFQNARGALHVLSDVLFIITAESIITILSIWQLKSNVAHCFIVTKNNKNML